MSTEVLMPKVGMSTSEIVLQEWLVASGDEVAADQLIAMVESEKTVIEVEAICDGFIDLRLDEGGEARPGESQSTETHFFQTPGLPIAMPSTAADAKGLLKTAIRSNDPVLFLEHMLLCLQNEESEVPDGDHLVPFGEAVVRREGGDVTVVAFGAMVNQALIAAETLDGQGISVEVVDPRTIVALDADAIFASVAKTNRLVNHRGEPHARRPGRAVVNPGLNGCGGFEDAGATTSLGLRRSTLRVS